MVMQKRVLAKQVAASLTQRDGTIMERLLKSRTSTLPTEISIAQIPGQGKRRRSIYNACCDFRLHSDRGNCYFFGQISMSTSMWQTVNLTNTIDPLLIDSHRMKFNLSGWIGGWDAQNDNAAVSVVFADQSNQIIGNRTTIGPVLAAARGYRSSLLFRQANGLVPVGTRSLTVIVTMTCIIAPSNDGAVDNIGIYLYQ